MGKPYARRLCCLAGLAGLLATALTGCSSAGNGDGNGNGNGNGSSMDMSASTGDAAVWMQPSRWDGGDPWGDGGYVDPCSDAAKLVYVVDVSNKLYSFSPQKVVAGDTNPADLFTQIGTGPLNCPVTTMGATPFSMGIDRTPTAWVLYNDGEIFKVSTQDATCTATTFDNGAAGTDGGVKDFNTFGMGFSANTPGSDQETLFIGGNSSTGGNLAGTEYLGSISFNKSVSPPALSAAKISYNEPALGGWPELSGTGDAKLWAFFPQLSGINAAPRVSQLSKADGSETNQIDLSTDTSITGNAKSWAFAVWGGDYWIFLKRASGDTSTNVFHVSTKTGMTTVAEIPNTGTEIVGAGVSTCAPTSIPIN